MTSEQQAIVDAPIKFLLWDGKRTYWTLDPCGERCVGVRIRLPSGKERQIICLFPNRNAEFDSILQKARDEMGGRQ
jgi:hypothetical protein